MDSTLIIFLIVAVLGVGLASIVLWMMRGGRLTNFKFSLKAPGNAGVNFEASAEPKGENPPQADAPLLLPESPTPPSQEAIHLNERGTTALNQGQYPEALNYLQQALVITRDIGDRAGARPRPVPRSARAAGSARSGSDRA